MKAPKGSEITVVWRTGEVVRIDEFGRMRDLPSIAPLPEEKPVVNLLDGDYEL